MDSKLLNYVLSAIILVLGFLLFQNGCQKKNDTCDYTRYQEIINIQVGELDSLITENNYLKYKVDSLYHVDKEENVRFIYKTNTIHDTIKSFKEILVQDSTVEVKTEKQLFSNDSYEVSTDVLYRGEIVAMNIRHRVLKYPVNFIPPTKIYVRDNVVIRKEEKVKRILYASGDVNFDKFNPQNAYFGLGYKDKMDRIFVVSKGIDSQESFKIQYLQPIIKL